MTATSHAIIGASIAVAVKEPVLALPFSFLSHFVADALPHIGLDEFGGHGKKPKLFHRMLIVDATALAVFLAYLLLANVPWVVFACVFLAGSPDFVWAYRYAIQEKWGKNKPTDKNAFNRFHSKIQWSQTLRGAYLEIPLSTILLIYVVANT